MKEVESTLKTTIISSEDELHTFEIRKELVDVDGKVGIIILLYPGTKASEVTKCDDTTRAIVEHMESFGFSCVRIVNLFSRVCQARMSTRNIVVDTENLDYIHSILEEKDSNQYEWVIAWGASMSKSQVVNTTKRKIIEMVTNKNPSVVLKQITANDISLENQNAIHPLWLKIRASNTEWYLQKYNIPKELIKQENESSEKKQVGINENMNLQGKASNAIYQVEPKKKRKS